MNDPVIPGQLLADRFRVVRRIASGGMGVVYEAWDETLDRRIALKCARLGHDRYLRPEVRLATEVSHPNICKIYEIHTTDSPDGPLEFITMELLEGRTLARRLEEGPIPQAEATAIARDLCAGVAEAHRNGVIHGDLKSANVILTKNPDETIRAVITDFGLARAASVQGSKGGTPGYMAPELYDGGSTTVASDIYALGVILYELVSGVRPDRRAAMMASTVKMEPNESPVAADRNAWLAEMRRAPVSPLGSRWDGILRKCLHTDPSQRYRNAEEVLAALGPSMLRRRILIGAGALLFALVAAFVTYRQSTAPAQTVKLDFAPVNAPAALASEARALTRDGLREIRELKNSRQIAFSARAAGPVTQTNATHRISVDLNPAGDRLRIHVALLDLRSGTPLAEWSAVYAPSQLRYAPVALAGVVSSAFHLPPLTTYATVNKAASATYRKGLALFEDDRRLDRALEAMQSAVMLDPDSALTWAGLAEAQRRKYRLTLKDAWRQQTQESFDQAERRNADCAEVHRIAGLLLYDANDPDGAIARMRRAIELQPQHPDGFRRLGEFYFNRGQYPEALKADTDALRLAPRDVRVYQDLEELYTREGKLTEASAVMRKAIELAPDRPELRIWLAGNLVDQGMFTEAETEVRAVMQQQVDSQTLMLLGQILLYRNQADEATGYLAQVTTLDTTNQLGWVYLGVSLLGSGHPVEARRAFEQGLAVSEREVVKRPRDGYRHSLLAYFCAQAGQAARAGVEAGQALQLGLRDNSVLWMAALAYEHIGDRDAALKALASAPRSLLEDLKRWPEARELTGDQRYQALLQASAAGR